MSETPSETPKTPEIYKCCNNPQITYLSDGEGITTFGVGQEPEAILILENLLLNHKGEKIEDEALLKLGELYEVKKAYAKAEKNYQMLIEYYNEDILADDAYYKLAQLYETKLNQHVIPKTKKSYRY